MVSSHPDAQNRILLCLVPPKSHAGMGLVPRFDRARNPHVGFVTLRPWLSDMSQLGRLPVDSLRALAVARVGVSDRSAPDSAADVTRSAHARTRPAVPSPSRHRQRPTKPLKHHGFGAGSSQPCQAPAVLTRTEPRLRCIIASGGKARNPERFAGFRLSHKGRKDSCYAGL